jgi:hypothetical protein
VALGYLVAELPIARSKSLGSAVDSTIMPIRIRIAAIAIDDRSIITPRRGTDCGSRTGIGTGRTAHGDGLIRDMGTVGCAGRVGLTCVGPG